jgi:hypothetical protein
VGEEAVVAAAVVDPEDVDGVADVVAEEDSRLETDQSERIAKCFGSQRLAVSPAAREIQVGLWLIGVQELRSLRQLLLQEARSS